MIYYNENIKVVKLKNKVCCNMRRVLKCKPHALDVPNMPNFIE